MGIIHKKNNEGINKIRTKSFQAINSDHHVNQFNHIGVSKNVDKESTALTELRYELCYHLSKTHQADHKLTWNQISKMITSSMII